ncbi:MAG: hypothetical protein QNJ64_03540 [Crocosphaera sp.]|nr:hypothetical protein [Crocosphaera sp.]
MNKERVREIFLFCLSLGCIFGCIPLLLGKFFLGMYLFLVGNFVGLIPGIIAVLLVDKMIIFKEKERRRLIEKRQIRKIPKPSNRILEIGMIGGLILGLLLGIAFFYVVGFIGTGLGDSHHSVVSFLVGLGMGVVLGLILGLLVGIIMKLMVKTNLI